MIGAIALTIDSDLRFIIFKAIENPFKIYLLKKKKFIKNYVRV
jgi:hypothetical protein